MRISDWSSDVCSSDLAAGGALPHFAQRGDFRLVGIGECGLQRRRHGGIVERSEAKLAATRTDRRQKALGRVADEEEQAVGRRFFEILEQGVGAASFGVVARVDEERKSGV